MINKMPADSTLSLTEQLLTRPSLAPDDGGCMTVFCKRFERIGFNCEGIEIAVFAQLSVVFRRIPDVLLPEHV